MKKNRIEDGKRVALKKNHAIILTITYDMEDNYKFIANVTECLKWLNERGIKITPKNISIKTGYSVKEIELNLNEIQVVMDALNIE